MMLLKKIELRNFKRFANFPAQFSTGINVVKGPLNETGKSTLLEGIIVALFSNPKSTARRLEDYASWGSTTKRFETSLEFEEKGNRYSLNKDFQKGVIKLVNRDTGEELDTPREVSQRIEELLGTDSDNLFRCSSCIYQDQISEVTSGRKEISESLEEVVTGGEEKILISKVIQKLDDKVYEIRKGLDRPARFLGALARLKGEIESAEQRLREISNAVTEVEAKKIELVEINKDLAQIKHEYERSKTLLDKNKFRIEVELSIAKLAQKYNEIAQSLTEINTLMEKSKQAHDALNSIEGFEDETRVSEIRTELDTIQIRKGDIKHAIAKRWEEKEQAKEELNKQKFFRLLGSKQSIACIAVISIGGIIGTIASSLYFLALVIIGMAALVASMWAKSKPGQQEKEISILKKRIQDMEEALKEELPAEESKLLNELKCSTLGEFQTKEKDFQRLKKEKERYENQLEGKLGTRNIEEIEQQRMETARNLAVEQAKITEDIKATALSPERYIELEKMVEKLEATLKQREQDKNRCEVFIEMARFDVEEQIKLEEELDSLRGDLRLEERRVKVYELAAEFLSRAKSDAFLAANEVLENETRKYFAIFTNGKYDQVKIGNGNSEFLVYSKEKGDWVKPEELSGGVIDEFYLAYRLALVKLIFGNKNPPLLLDDPFGNFDPLRLNKAMLLFKDLSKDHQIIIFTLKDIYDEIADNLVQLR
jgi:DNA repair exonuclease SbcCD ATPase subunit